MNELTGRVAIITGAASGIGMACAEAYAREGAKVVLADIDEPGGKAVADRLAASGATVLFQRCDVSDYDDVRTVCESAVSAYGRLDLMHNNAGIGPFGDTLLEIEPELFDRIIGVNLKSVYYGMKHAVPIMIAQGGGVVTSTSSVGALPGVLGGLAYSAAKAGIVRMTTEVAAMYADKGIRANCVLPGLTLSAMTEMRTPGLTPDQREALFATMQPVPRALKGSDIADAAVWLASDRASFVTGQAVVVDGGMIMAGWGNRVEGNVRHDE